MLLTLAPIVSFALSEDAWLPSAGEVDLETEYTYSRFSHVQGAKDALSHTSNDHELLFDLGIAATDDWHFQLDAELAQTPEQSFGWRSFAGQARYQCCNDMKGDSFSLVLGFNARVVSHPALGDISSPYAAKGDFELFSSWGVSWLEQDDWTDRVIAVLAAGQGTHGAPWLRGDLAYQHKWGPHHLNIFGNSLWGLGSKESINLHHFHTAHKGWGNYRHGSIDTGAEYKYDMGKWGEIFIAYTFRAFAHVFPEYVNFFTIGYSVPLGKSKHTEQSKEQH